MSGFPPSQTCATGNPTGMPISRLPSASLQASSACKHVRLNLEADVGADTMTYWAVIDDTLPLTSCTGRDIQCVWGGGGGMSVGLCSVVTCKKANEEPDIFRMVSVNQGWHSHQRIWLKHSIQAHNKHRVRTVSKAHVKLIDYMDSIYSPYTHRQTMRDIFIYNFII